MNNEYWKKMVQFACVKIIQINVTFILVYSYFRK